MVEKETAMGAGDQDKDGTYLVYKYLIIQDMAWHGMTWAEGRRPWGKHHSMHA